MNDEQSRYVGMRREEGEEQGRKLGAIVKKHCGPKRVSTEAGPRGGRCRYFADVQQSLCEEATHERRVGASDE
eukprot:1993932-Pleurochrysis_carterae.AAC.3